MKKIISVVTLLTLIALAGISLSAAANNAVSFSTESGLMESFTADTTGTTLGTLVVNQDNRNNQKKISFIILSDTKIVDKKGTPITPAKIIKGSKLVVKVKIVGDVKTALYISSLQ